MEDRTVNFISNVYTKLSDKYKWQCLKCNHIWKASASNVINGSGCPKCAGFCYTMRDVHKIARQTDFKCLSKEFLGMTKKHKWECKDGHIWHTSPLRIKNRQGCPQCHTRITEERCRFVFESLTRHKFPTTWAAFSKKMQLDGYCKELKLAFEYQGKQHYEIMPYFHRTEQDFISQQDRDKIKTQLCLENNIRKIDIPYTQASDNQALETFIKEQLFQIDIPLYEIDWKEFIGKPSKLKFLKDMLKSRNIDCLSTTYIRAKHKLLFRCGVCEFEWTTTPSNIKRHGCPQCAGKIKKTLEDMHDLAQRYNLKFMSEQYIKHSVKHKWKCLICNHVFMIPPDSIKHEISGCHKCSQRRFNHKRTEFMHKLGEINNLIFLSDQYINSRLKHKWKCLICETIFMKRPTDVQQGKSCPACSKKSWETRRKNAEKKLLQEKVLC